MIMPDLQQTVADLGHATLLRITIDWEPQQATFRFKVGPTDVVISAEGVTSVSVPHHDPWGPSREVYMAEPAQVFEYQELRLRMQSGDEVRVAADEFRVHQEDDRVGD